VRIAGYPPLTAEAGAGAAAEVAALAEAPAGGAVDFGTEAGLYQAALRVPAVVCGPGDMAQAHVADEYL
jgi:acetylornithine deacetylase